MKRSQVVFITVVFTALITGILVERSHRFDPTEAFDFRSPRRVEFEPLEAEFGDHDLTGVVLGADGVPVEEVLIHLRRTDAHTPLDVAEPLHWAHTGADGSFALTEIPAGTYEAALLHGSVPNSSIEIRIPHAGDVRWSLPELLEPIEGLEPLVRSDFAGSLEPPPGLVVGGEPWSWAGYEVAVVPSEDNAIANGAVERRAAVNEAGGFEIPSLVEANYHVRVLPPWARGGTWPLLANATYSHGKEDEAPLIRIRSAVLSGLVRDAGGRPIEGALVQVRRADAPGRLWPPTSTDGNGRFAVPHLRPGAYRVRVLAGAGLFDEEVEVSTGQRLELNVDGLATRAER